MGAILGSALGALGGLFSGPTGGLGLGSLISGASGLAGAGIQAGASSKAAREQLIGQQLALQTQEQEAAAAQGTQNTLFNIGAGGVMPFVQGGQGAYNTLLSKLPQFTAPVNPTQATLENFPGYQWMKGQGDESILSSIGPGMRASGAALKGIDQYNTGLASTNFQQVFQDIWANQQNPFNMLMGAVQPGINAAGSLMSGATGAGNTALQTLTNLGTNLGSTITGGGQAAAAGTLGAASATAGGLTNLGNAAGQYGILSSLLSSGAFGGAGNVNNALFAQNPAQLANNAGYGPAYGGS